MAAYLFAAFLVNYSRFKSVHHPRKEVIVHVFDASTFAGSVMLLAGVMDPPILTAIGSTKPFLLIAGLGGMVYSLAEFFPKNNGTKIKSRNATDEADTGE